MRGCGPRSPRPRLLFVAHREEILDQSGQRSGMRCATTPSGRNGLAARGPRDSSTSSPPFRACPWPISIDLPADHFDVVIIDEFHHAAANSYRSLIERLEPKELLGLTATPERADGLPILHWFGDRIAAELRLWDAIEQHRLVPFAYYGIHDGVDLRQVPWRRGQGYDPTALSNVYTSNDAWARFVVQPARRPRR